VDFFLSRRKIISTLLKVAFCLGLAGLLLQFDFHSIEFLTYDMRVRTSPAPRLSDQLTLVQVDRDTVRGLDRSPSPLDLLTLLENILLAQPREILIFLSVPGLQGTFQEQTRLAQFLREHPNIFFMEEDLFLPGQEDRLNMSPPFGGLKKTSAPITMDKYSFSADGVTRRVMLSYLGEPLFYARWARLMNGYEPGYQFRGTFYYKESTQALIRYHPKGSFKTLSFLDTLGGRFKADDFYTKTVLIGVDTEANTEDYIQTPYSRDVTAMSHLEAQANMMETLIKDQGIAKVPEWLKWLITICVSLATGYVVFSLSPLTGLAYLVSLVLTYCVASWAFFAGFGVWIPMAHPLLAVAICYYFFIPYRLIKENQKSWEFEQKNRLLTQVEELKSNFLGMMSHDLKTPLARIQGLAEVVLTESKSLDTKHRSLLKQIGQSTEELTRFISSILSLNRIESKELKLNLQSKDINEIVGEVIERHQFLAQTKNITFETSFDPLFSVKVDPELIRQVVSNLVENAIKYGPEDSVVSVKTHEVSDQVLIEISDEGSGIPQPELENVFMKFYRSRDAKSSPIKGTGLGLYLAKYFVELHQGRISVSNLPQKGCIFKVELPL